MRNLFTRIGLVLLLSGLVSTTGLRAQPAPEPASASTMSGQRAEPQANSTEKKQEAEGGTEAFKRSPSVVKLGGMLGMKPATASSAFEWLNFLILAAAILYGIAKALPKVFRDRTATIQKDITEARSAKEQADARMSAVEARLAKLDDEIAAMKADAERDAALEETRIKQQIEDETKQILKSAEQEIAAAQAQATRSLRAFAAGVAVDRAASRLEITPDDDRALIRNFASRLTPGSRN